MPVTKQTPEDLAAALMPQLDAFVGFARKRIADPELAADVVQDSLLKAIMFLLGSYVSVGVGLSHVTCCCSQKPVGGGQRLS